MYRSIVALAAALVVFATVTAAPTTAAQVRGAAVPMYLMTKEGDQ